MVLSKETKYGLTFGQILSVLGLLGSIIAVVIRFNIQLTEINGRINASEIKIEQLERGRIDNKTAIESLRIDNRSDHIILSEKVDQVLFELRK